MKTIDIYVLRCGERAATIYDECFEVERLFSTKKSAVKYAQRYVAKNPPTNDFSLVYAGVYRKTIDERGQNNKQQRVYNVSKKLSA